MDISSLILGVLVLCMVIVLEARNRSTQMDEESSDLDRDYFYRRSRRRRLVHVIMGLVGVLALGAGIVGRHSSAETFAVFYLTWAAVPLLIVLAVMLAFADAYQTYRYHEEKLPEVHESSFGNLDVAAGEDAE